MSNELHNLILNRIKFVLNEKLPEDRIGFILGKPYSIDIAFEQAGDQVIIQVRVKMEGLRAAVMENIGTKQ